MEYKIQYNTFRGTQGRKLSRSLGRSFFFSVSPHHMFLTKYLSRTFPVVTVVEAVTCLRGFARISSAMSPDMFRFCSKETKVQHEVQVKTMRTMRSVNTRLV